MKKRYAIIALAMVMMLAVSLPVSACGILYTQGYWKNHTEVWDESCESTILPSDTFFGSGMTWIQMLKVPTKGDAYIILAHQYIAAKLNLWTSNAVPTEAVLNALYRAEILFNAYDPGMIPEGLREQAIHDAGILDAWNNGI